LPASCFFIVLAKEMQRYILKRLIQAVVTLFIMSILVFFLVRLTGNPIVFLIGDYATSEDIARITKEYGLDRPLPEQYRIFLFKALRGDLGRSVFGDQSPVLDKILERLPASLELAGIALLISVLVGLPLGVIAATKKGSFLDTSARVLSLLGQSVPPFWLGIVLMYIFAVWLHLLPTSGYCGIKCFILPAITMSTVCVAAITRLTRSSMLDVLNCEYIKLARIKGLSEKVVIWKHVLRNSLIPVVTFVGQFLPTMITGALVIETVFAWPGIGRLAYEAAMQNNYPVLQGVVLFITLLFVLLNLGVDILYAYLDPRIRYT
jgi:peptide/nickel transport system permease protein